MTIQELHDKRNNCVKLAREVLEKAENRDKLTAEESQKWDGYMNEADEIRQRIERETQTAAAEAALNDIPEPRGAKPLEGETREDAEKRVAEEKKMEAFRTFLSGGLRSLNGDERRALQGDIDSKGGFVKPPAMYLNQLIKNVDDILFVRRLGTIIQLTDSDEAGIPALDSDPDDAEWTSEIKTGSEDNAMSFGKRALKAHPLAKRIRVSNDFLFTAGNAEAIIRDRMAYKLALPQEKAFMVGDGNKKPLGLFTASADGISTARDIAEGNTTTETSFDNLNAMKYGIKAQYMTRAEWLGNRTWVKKVAGLKDDENRFLWEPSRQAGQPDRLLGHAVNMSEHAPGVFASGNYVAVFGDFSWYYIADHMTAEMKRLDELYAESNQTGFITRARLDGMPALEEAFVRSKLA